MKVFLAIVVAAVSGLVGVNVAIELVFPHLLNARFPLVNWDGVFSASARCEHYSFVFFVLSSFAGVSVFAHFLGKKPKPQVVLGMLAALATGAISGTLSCMIYFYNAYSFSN